MARHSMSRPHNLTGRQRWYFAVQKPITAFTGENKQPSITWLTWAHVWGELYDHEGKEVVWEQQVQATTMLTIECRWFSGLRQRMRILLGDRIFNVAEVQDVGSLRHIWRIQVAELDPEI
jgi:hypothetical protein